jgi:hypothetical protein
LDLILGTLRCSTQIASRSNLNYQTKYCVQAVSEIQCSFRLLYSMIQAHKSSFYIYEMRAGEYRAGESAEQGERETERNRLVERVTEQWRVLEMAWVVNLTVEIEHLSISMNRLNTQSIK